MIKSIIGTSNKNLRMLVLLQIFNYGLIYVTVADEISGPNVYLYLRYKFHVSSPDYAYMLTFVMIAFTASLLLAVPLATNILGISDSLLLCFCLFTGSAGNLLSSFATSLYPVYFLGKLATFMTIAIWGVARSQLSRCIDEEEVGRPYFYFLIMSNALFLISNVLFVISNDLLLMLYF